MGLLMKLKQDACQHLDFNTNGLVARLIQVACADTTQPLAQHVDIYVARRTVMLAHPYCNFTPANRCTSAPVLKGQSCIS
jgi:hypothetical protein